LLNTRHPAANPVTGIIMKVMSVIVFTGMAAIIKATADHVPPGEAVFFRSFFAIPLIVVWLALKGEMPRGLTTANPAGHFWRGLCGVCAMGFGFTALGLLPFPEAVAIGYAAPLIATILAAMFLGENLRVFRLSAVAVGLCGVFIVLYPNLTVLRSGNISQALAAGALVALLGAVFAALAQVFVRKLVMHERTPAIVFWFSVTAAALSLATLPFGWVVPEPGEAALLVLSGVMGGLGQILLTESYRHAETAVIASFEYSSMLLALATGYFIFGEVPTGTMLAGAALIVAAGLFILYRERKLGIERAQARKAMTPQG
jgi:drug/metabolite transporter (DMT)-like permease